MERYGIGWQERHAADLKASRKPGGSAFGGGGFIHVPGQTGTYAQYLRLGGPEKGIGTANIMAGGRMSAYRAGVRLAGSPLRAPITYTSIRGKPPVFVPTESLKGGEAFMPLSGTSGFVPLPSTSPATLGGGAIAPLSTGGTGGISGITTGMTSIGGNIIDTVKQYIPLIVIGGIAILGIKMLMGRR